MNDSNKPTINDVARLAKVSKKTVSRVINKSPLLSDKTRQLVESVIAEIGYVPNPQARALALRRNFIIAAIHDNPNAQFLVNVQQGILEGIAGTEFGLMVEPVDRNSPTIVDDIRGFLERQRPYGVVFLPPISENDELASLCEALGTLYVRMVSRELDKPEHIVMSNDREAVYGAVQHLIAMGHEKIALIEGPDSLSPAERRAGYEQAMADAGLPVHDWMIATGGYTFETGVEAGLALIDGKERPTAIFASNDEMAIGAVIAARRRGIEIPRGLSIVGFDDTPLSSHIWPSLTTVRWPIVEMAHAAATKIIHGDEVDANIGVGLPSTLIERDSVVAPPKR
ncbi:LacI family DNA-binding transcriptional regulator [Pontixanthobacter aestiaquae]|uniref:LacI family DNA-binding transcriptional regulator n=1 Tax=Pontixanthobacter aestiaquae TaxID=1509367 RepID=A0A844Z9Q5_9SPHN|nr:LacI family DNA-binding transcriptional regulator [Pontixanthobacter aestiaquae]MDN3644749.1 LacI family DNA-binding transcriptional regulator [Pontixanthobacter aestiaquae]MXO84244.1 LacI family DNA-binding transcriptional regulator [Pontixanthobacter aestiaquae]